MVEPTSSNRGERFIARKILRAAALCIAGLAIACAGCESDKDRKAREAAGLTAKFNEQLRAENLAAARALQERARVDRERRASVLIALRHRVALLRVRRFQNVLDHPVAFALA